MGASLGQEGIDDAGIELPLPGFELFPVNRDLDGVGMHILHGRPHLLEDGGPAARIVHLRAQNEVGGIVHK